MRTLSLTALVIAAVVFLLTVPMSFHVAAPAVFQVHDARTVYVTVSGRIVAGAAPGDVVHKGQVSGAVGESRR